MPAGSMVSAHNHRRVTALSTRLSIPHRYLFDLPRAAFGAAVIAGALAFSPAPATAQDLADALIAAYSNNPTLAARRARLRATDEQVPQALSNWRPSVAINGDAGYERNRSTLRTTDRTQNRNPATIGLSVTQPLYRGGRTLAWRWPSAVDRRRGGRRRRLGLGSATARRRRPIICSARAR